MLVQLAQGNSDGEFASYFCRQLVMHILCWSQAIKENKNYSLILRACVTIHENVQIFISNEAGLKYTLISFLSDPWQKLATRFHLLKTSLTCQLPGVDLLLFFIYLASQNLCGEDCWRCSQQINCIRFLLKGMNYILRFPVSNIWYDRTDKAI